jgi:1-acyl-sn-glycerol-3-phosphate acyltransferase
MTSPLTIVDPEVRDRISRLEVPFDGYGYDPYGISKDHLTVFFSVLSRLYRSYFSVTVEGIENVPPRGRGLLVGNHSGGVALDGAMVLTSLLLEMDPPRLGHGMVEKFVMSVPFLSEWFARIGQLGGLPENAVRVLEDERLLMVFPEGARGTAKLFWERYTLVRFGTGFMRLALQTGAPIVPFAFVGAGEAIPTIANLRRLGKLVGAPYVPVTPWLLPVPLPVRCKIVYGEPMRFAGTGNEADELVLRWVEQVRARVANLIAVGRGTRRGA